MFGEIFLFFKDPRETVLSRAKARRVKLLAGMSALGLCLTLTALTPAPVSATAVYRTAEAPEESPLVEAVAVTVDGVHAVTVDSRETALALLEEIRRGYETPLTESAAFRERVELLPCLTEPEGVMAPADARALLDPENTASPVALTVLTMAPVTREEAVPFVTETVLIPDQYSDETSVTRSGVDGWAVNTYSVIYENGREELATLTDSRIVTEPVSEIVTQGALPGSRYDSRGVYIWPTTGVLTSKFGSRNISIGSSNHKGIDIGNAAGTPVCAADGGVVIFAGKNGGYGNFVAIQHDNGAVTHYAHMRKILVEVGQRVAQGQQIGEMGRTGTATGNHLHFEILPDGETRVDPVGLLTGELQRY